MVSRQQTKRKRIYENGTTQNEYCAFSRVIIGYASYNRNDLIGDINENRDK